MIEIVKSIFQQLNFSIAPQESLSAGSFLASFKSSLKEEYFLVLSVSQMQQVRRNEEGLSNSLADLLSSWKGVSPGVSKNISLLVLWQALSEEEVENNKKLIFELEEDPYDFKKYVLFYTESELEAFRNRFSEQGYSLESLQQELNSSDSFIAFKGYLKAKSSNVEHVFLYYSLLSRIFIKMPILRTTNQHQELYDLQSVIDATVSQGGLGVLQKRLLELEESVLETATIDELINRLCDE